MAHHVEAISATHCLECGHSVTDHKSGSRWGTPRYAPDHRYCIGNYGTCLCRKLHQPHTAGKVMVYGCQRS